MPPAPPYGRMIPKLHKMNVSNICILDSRVCHCWSESDHAQERREDQWWGRGVHWNCQRKGMHYPEVEGADQQLLAANKISVAIYCFCEAGLLNQQKSGWN